MLSIQKLTVFLSLVSYAKKRIEAFANVCLIGSLMVYASGLDHEGQISFAMHNSFRTELHCDQKAGLTDFGVSCLLSSAF